MREGSRPWLLPSLGVFALLASCSSGDDASSSGSGPTKDPTTTAAVLGEPHSGLYHLGPVDFAETVWHNACAPDGGYRSALRNSTGLGGEYLAGLANEFAQDGAACDACILVKTATGRSIVLRVVTRGIEAEAGDIDVSPNAYAAINTGEDPRSMTWEFAKCPDAGGIAYEFQTEANVWWTSLWVRSPRVALTKVEVKSTNHPDFFEMRRGTDGTLNDDGGFGEGPFTIRLTAMDGQTLTHDFTGFAPGELVETSDQFN